MTATAGATLPALPRAVAEYAEYSHAARTGQHRLLCSCLFPPLPHAVFMPWKSSSGRSNGQPSTLDCSGNAVLEEEVLKKVRKGLRLNLAIYY
ncbi:hypothetical protein GH714_022266 [Hevea brasiliensis]|uniref:Uncharacterized protein n=1 Tax=Hevea brasiliensis TaxID=3981 RepID=A0A6A6MYF8_HEVBR|nr:hypothetical protein GH714_022266 [Hevea brasiliensis]